MRLLQVLQPAVVAASMSYRPACSSTHRRPRIGGFHPLIAVVPTHPEKQTRRLSVIPAWMKFLARRGSTSRHVAAARTHPAPDLLTSVDISGRADPFRVHRADHQNCSVLDPSPRMFALSCRCIGVETDRRVRCCRRQRHLAAEFRCPHRGSEDGAGTPRLIRN